MAVIDGRQSIGTIDKVLRYAREKGLRLWSENGQLHYRAPKGSLTEDELALLHASRQQLITFLESGSRALCIEPTAPNRRRAGCVPLTFSQMTHWNLYQLGEYCSSRYVACAIRMKGRLSRPAMQKAIEEMVRRHEVLRSRIVVVNGVPMQKILTSWNCELGLDDLSAVPQTSHELELKNLYESYTFAPIQVTEDALFEARLVKFKDSEHVLIVAMEHIIADGFSLEILLRDFFLAYAQEVNGRPSRLPEIHIQFADYASWQRSRHSSWLDDHGSYWNDRLRGAERMRFPDDVSGTDRGLGIVRFQIDKNLKENLSEWCRLRRTTLVLGVFAVYVALVLRWCGVSEGVFRFQTNGRFSKSVENTVGYFAFPLHLRLALHQEDSFLDLLDRVIEEYYRAFEHADHSYVEAQIPRPDFTRNSCFNWVSGATEPRSFDLDVPHGPLRCSRILFEKRSVDDFELDAEPQTGFLEIGSEIRGYVIFPANRFSTEKMERFASHLLALIRRMPVNAEERIEDIVMT